MKSGLFTLSVLFACLVFTAEAEAQQAQFDHANSLMEQQRVEEAFDIYRSIEESGRLSGKLYFNMALASMYQDSLGLAKYYLLQAVKFPDTREEASQALDYVNNQFDRRSAVLPKLPWDRFFEWLGSMIGASTLMITGILLLNLGVGGLIGSWFTNKASAWLKRSGYATGILSLLLMLSALYLYYHDNRYDTAVMVDRQAIVYERPSPNSASVSNAYEGYIMTVDTRRSADETEWYYVRLENGMFGWIQQNRVRSF
jgi:tetratricopeptide (TPR) repeat protein